MRGTKLLRKHDVAFQRVVEGSVISSAKSDGPAIEDLSEDGVLSQAMSEDDPDLASGERSQTYSAAAAAQRPPSPPDPPKALPAKIECSDAGRAQVQAWDLDSVQAMHAWCQERLETVYRATPEGSSLAGAGSCAHSQEKTFRVDHGVSAAFSLEEGWTVVRRRKEKKVVQKEEKS